MANSYHGYAHLRNYVVNCFQISNFVLWQTAGTINLTTHLLL